MKKHSKIHPKNEFVPISPIPFISYLLGGVLSGTDGWVGGQGPGHQRLRQEARLQDQDHLPGEVQGPTLLWGTQTRSVERVHELLSKVLIPTIYVLNQIS